MAPVPGSDIDKPRLGCGMAVILAVVFALGLAAAGVVFMLWGGFGLARL
jgi:hypothetical protein